MTVFVYTSQSRDGMRTDYTNTTKDSPQQHRAILKEIAKEKMKLIKIEKRTYSSAGLKIENIEI
jgi:hypothetical protein